MGMKNAKACLQALIDGKTLVYSNPDQTDLEKQINPNKQDVSIRLNSMGNIERQYANSPRTDWWHIDGTSYNFDDACFWDIKPTRQKVFAWKLDGTRLFPYAWCQLEQLEQMKKKYGDDYIELYFEVRGVEDPLAEKFTFFIDIMSTIDKAFEDYKTEICVWANYDWCFLEDLEEYGRNKSDD